MSGKWEVAGKKKTGTGNKKTAKKQKKDVKLPTTEDSISDSFAMSSPLTEHQNIYNLMSRKEKLYEEDTDSDNKENLITKPRVSSSKPKSKKKSPTQANKTTSKNEHDVLKEQLANVDSEELITLIEEVKKKFPKHPHVWLKDIQSYLQMKITVRESDPGLMMYGRSYPHDMLSSELQGFLTSVFCEVPENILNAYYIECLNTLARDMRAGSSGYYIRMLLQSMSMNCPKTKNSKAVTTELQTLIEDSVSRTKECVSLLWCLQMTPQIKLDTQLKVWFTWMLPILQGKKTEKPVQDFIFNSLDNTLSEVITSKSKLELSPSDFFGYLDLVFTVNSNLLPFIQSLMLDKLMAVKFIAFSVDSQLRSFFPSLLIRLHNSDTEQQKYMLQFLVECLQKDDQCWLLWQQMFVKHINNSLVLLEHIHKNWPKFVKSVNKSALKQTLDHLIITLSPTNGKTKIKESHRRALQLCQDMRHAIGSPVKAAFRLTLLVVFTLVAVYILHDVKQFGSFHASRTGKICSTIIQHNTVKQALVTLQGYGSAAHDYGMKHAPILMQYMYTIFNSVSSTLTLFAVCVQNNFNYAIDNRAAIADQMKKKTVEMTTYGYEKVTSLLDEENKAWLQETGLKYMELCKSYISWGSDTLVRQYFLYQQLFVDNFINEPVTIDRMKEWGLDFYSWTIETSTFYYHKLYSTFVE